MTIILLVLGFVLLIKGANWLVDGASSIAKKLKISPLVIGLTIVSFGTSAPELIVNVFASFQGANDIAVGNILGSNIANILLILGVSCYISALKLTSDTVWKEIPFSLLAVIVLSILVNDKFFLVATDNSLNRPDGLIFLSFFAIFLYYVYSISKKESINSATEIKTYNLSQSFLMLLGGIASLSVGGKIIVDNAIILAESFGLSQSFIGLTVVALGTSLPELATSATAAWKKNSDIAVGNIVGSNIFNVFFVLGISSIIAPLNFSPEANFDILVAIVATLALFIFMFIGKKNILQRWQGVAMVGLYVLYIGYLVYRG